MAMTSLGTKLRQLCAQPVSGCLLTNRVRKHLNVASIRACSSQSPPVSTGRFSITENLRASDFAVGSFAEVSHVFPQPEVDTFATICGDNNPLHVNPDFAKTTMFKGTIVHGILVTSLFSTLFGATLHGAIYVSQTVQFKRPVHVGATVVARTEVTKREEKAKGVLITCATTVRLAADNQMAVEGEAKVLVPHGAGDKKV